MKKNLPNIILLILLSSSSVLLFYLFKSFGLGMFLKAFGIFMILAGIFVFIFFLSIDPGYGWSKKVNFNSNYLAISAAVIICIAGSLMFFLGKEIQVSTFLEESEKTRCQQMRDGLVGNALGKDWFFLSDKKIESSVTLYLFQKRGEAEKYKVIVVDSPEGNANEVSKVNVSSAYCKNIEVFQAKGDFCAGIFEGDIVTRSPEGVAIGSKVIFNVKLTFNASGSSVVSGQKNIKLQGEYCLR